MPIDRGKKHLLHNRHDKPTSDPPLTRMSLLPPTKRNIFRYKGGVATSRKALHVRHSDLRSSGRVIYSGCVSEFHGALCHSSSTRDSYVVCDLLLDIEIHIIKLHWCHFHGTESLGGSVATKKRGFRRFNANGENCSEKARKNFKRTQGRVSCCLV